MHTGQHYRAGVGSVIYKGDGTIAIFSRSDNPDVWQFQQGGMDEGEEPSDTLWRELYEETGLRPEHFSLVTPYPTHTSYEYPPALRRDGCRGQTHVWYFLRIKPDVAIDLTAAIDKEFTAVRFLPFVEFMQTDHSFKHTVYQTLLTYYQSQQLSP